MTDSPILEPVPAYALWAASYPPHAHNPLMLAEERAMLELLPADLRQRSVLDAGCGSGRYLLHALRRGARRVLGVDLSAEMLGRARAELKIENEELKKSRSIANFPFSIFHFQLIQANLTAIPLRDCWADLTICGLTIGHIERLGTALAELRRVTR